MDQLAFPDVALPYEVAEVQAKVRSLGKPKAKMAASVTMGSEEVGRERWRPHFVVSSCVVFIVPQMRVARCLDVRVRECVL